MGYCSSSAAVRQGTAYARRTLPLAQNVNLRHPTALGRLFGNTNTAAAEKCEPEILRTLRLLVASTL
jgi:hypothetical protein